MAGSPAHIHADNDAFRLEHFHSPSNPLARRREFIAVRREKLRARRSLGGGLGGKCVSDFDNRDDRDIRYERGRVRYTAEVEDVWFLLIFVGVALVAAILVAGIFLYIRKHVVGGFGWLERRRMHREGTPAHATVIDVVRVPRYFVAEEYDTYRIVLEVTPQGAPSFRAPAELVWVCGKWGLMGVGRVLPVLCAGGRVMLDYPALRRETAAARTGEQAAAEERQRKLLDGG